MPILAKHGPADASCLYGGGREVRRLRLHDRFARTQRAERAEREHGDDGCARRAGAGNWEGRPTTFGLAMIRDPPPSGVGMAWATGPARSSSWSPRAVGR